MSSCRIVTLPDGTRVRVQGGGEVDPEYLQTLIDKIREAQARECHALSDTPMPEIAQRIHGRETYWCGLPRGHDGAHQHGTKMKLTWGNQ